MMPSEHMFDSFLRKCSSGWTEEDLRLEERIEGEHFPCPGCGRKLDHTFRTCPFCGDYLGLGFFTDGNLPEMTIGGFTVRISNLLLDWEGSTRVDLRIRNRECDRKNLSLVFNESAIIDAEGRQYVCKLCAASELSETRVLSDWFYVYGEAFVEGSLVFPSLKSNPERLIISLTEQDGTETCFQFALPDTDRGETE